MSPAWHVWQRCSVRLKLVISTTAVNKHPPKLVIEYPMDFIHANHTDLLQIKKCDNQNATMSLTLVCFFSSVMHKPFLSEILKISETNIFQLFSQILLLTKMLFFFGDHQLSIQLHTDLQVKRLCLTSSQNEDADVPPLPRRHHPRWESPTDRSSIDQAGRTQVSERF